MAVDLSRDMRFLFDAERWAGQVGVDLVQHEDLDFGLGLFFLPEAVQLGQAGLDGGKCAR